MSEAENRKTLIKPLNHPVGRLYVSDLIFFQDLIFRYFYFNIFTSYDKGYF